MISLKLMLKMPSDALPSHTLTLKKTKVDITTKLNQKLRKTQRKTFTKLKKKTTLLFALSVSKISSEKKYQGLLLCAMKLV